MGKIQISIPTPCHQGWENMTEVEKGRFCSSCQKTVVDFSTMSDCEVAMFFKKPSSGSVCGRFMEDQLNREMEIPRKRIPWVKYFFQFALPAFLISMKASAQQKQMQRNKPAVISVCNRSVGMITPVIITENVKIKGVIIDSASGLPIPNATIHIANTRLNVVADDFGKFELNAQLNSESIQIEATSIGYKMGHINYLLPTNKFSDEIRISLMPQVKDLDSVVIASSTSTRRLGGAYSICTKISTYQQIKEWIVPFQDSVKIYPNPVNRGSNFQIKFDLKNLGEYFLNIFDLNGREVMNRNLSISFKDQIENFVADSRFSGGTYIVRFTSKQSGKSFSQKIIIQ